MVMNEAVKMLPIGEIWDEYLRREGVVDDLHSMMKSKSMRTKYWKREIKKRIEKRNYNYEFFRCRICTGIYPHGE